MGDQEKMEVEALWRNMEKVDEQGDISEGDNARKPANTEKMEEMEKKNS